MLELLNETTTLLVVVLYMSLAEGGSYQFTSNTIGVIVGILIVANISVHLFNLFRGSCINAKQRCANWKNKAKTNFTPKLEHEFESRSLFSRKQTKKKTLRDAPTLSSF